MKVVLINPPQVFSKIMASAGVSPPLGLLYLAAFLKHSRHDTIVIDSVAEGVKNIYDVHKDVSCRGLSFNDIVARIPIDTALIGITNLFSFSFPVVRELTIAIKKIFPDIPIVVGGAHPSGTPVKTISESSIDFVVLSEGEETVVELLNNLEDYGAIKKIDGLAYKDEWGKPCVSPKTKFIEDLDNLPFPARELISIEKYYEIGEGHGPRQKKYTPILSSRGCPYQCTFCTPKLWNRRYRVRSAENIVSEIEECIIKYDIREFQFEDENLTVDKKRTIEICKNIINKNLNIRWQTPNGIRASVTDNEMLDLMKESGCHHITVAPESGSQRVLNEIINKKQELSKVTEVVEYASRIGMKTAAYFVLGLPGEKFEEAEMSIEYACNLAKIGLDEVAFSTFIPLPGSELYDQLVKKGKFNTDWTSLISIDDLSKIVSWSEHIPSKKLMGLKRKAFLKFYLIKLIYHPLKILRSIVNIIRKTQELKTERSVIAFIKRFG